MMAICHTAVPEHIDGQITYQAASPGRSNVHMQTWWDPERAGLELNAYVHANHTICYDVLHN